MTASDDLARLRLHILPVLGAMPMEEVRPRHIRDLVLAMRKQDVLAPRSIRHVYATAACMFRTAVADELIPFTPCVLAKGILPKNIDKDAYDGHACRGDANADARRACHVAGRQHAARHRSGHPGEPAQSVDLS